MLLALTGLDTKHVGYLVSLGGILGALVMLLGGDYADRRGDRFLNAFWFTVLMAGALLTLAAAPSPMIVMGAYLIFAATGFTISMFIASGWADVLHVRELAVGSAAINSLCGIGSFAMPFAWGATRDATGGFSVGLTALAVCALASAALTMQVRAGVRGRRAAVAVPIAV